MRHKSLNFRGEKEDEVLSHGWHANYSLLPPPPILYVATCHKHHQPTAISDISNLSLNTFLIIGQTHDWCTVHLSSSPGASRTLDLNNSSNLFVIFIALALRLVVAVKLENLKSPLARSFCLPLTRRQLWLQLEVIAVFFKWMWEAVYIDRRMFHPGDITVSPWGDWCHSNTPHQNGSRLRAV